MRKITLILAVMALIIAPKGVILAQEASSSASQVELPDLTKLLPKSPLDDLMNKWLGGGTIKEKIQEGMTKAQQELEALPGKVLDKTQKAAQTQLETQAQKAAQGVQEKTEGYVSGVVQNIKIKISNIIGNIKLFFKELFSKKTPTY